MTLGPLMIDVEGLELTEADTQRLADPRIGGVILFSRNYESIAQVEALIKAIHEVRTPRLLVAVDQEGGRVQRFLDGFTQLPPARWLGNEYDLDADNAKQLARTCGWIMAAELRAIGVDISFAPVVDLDLGLSEVIGDRAFHRKPEVIASLAIAYMQGMRDAGMMAVAKHFPGHGAVVADSHLELPEDQRRLDDMTDDLLPYQRMIAAGLPAIMIAHVKYPAIDRRVASLSPYWLQTELRGRLGFGGVIFSDDLSMRALEYIGDMPERVRQALDAGADMALICNDPEAVDMTLKSMGDMGNPVSQTRLVTMRPQPAEISDSQLLHDNAQWQSAIASLEAALARPELTLNG